MKPSELVSLEKDCVSVDSNYFMGVTYAVPKNGKGIYLIAGGINIPIAAEHVDKFLKEIKDVWELHKRK